MGNVTAQADLFVCADPEDHGMLRLANFSNLVSYGTSDQDSGYRSDLKGAKSGLAEWWRLQQCWKRVQDFEEHHGPVCSHIMSAGEVADPEAISETSVCHNPKAARDKYGAQLDKVFFANRDHVFGGSRRGFERAATMMSRIESDYFRKTLTTYYPLDWDLVLNSDWNGQLHWSGIVFPRDVLDPEHCCSQQDLEKKLAQLKEFDKNGTRVDGKVCLSSYSFAPDTMRFQSEVSFLLDMLRGGIEMHDRIEEQFRNFTNLVRYRTAEDDGGYKADLKNIDQPMRYHEPGTPPGQKSIQWWRLQQCWGLVQQYEKRFGFRYDFYYKTRTDCDMRGGCYTCLGAYEAATKKYGAQLDKVFFANSDRVFGGSRPGFERAATMMSRIESDYFRKTLTTYYPLDWDLVLRSEWRGQLHWWGIVFPRDVLDPRHCCDFKHIKDNLARLKEFDKKGMHVDGKVCNLKGVAMRATALSVSVAVRSGTTPILLLDPTEVEETGSDALITVAVDGSRGQMVSCISGRIPLDAPTWASCLEAATKSCKVLEAFIRMSLQKRLETFLKPG
ncbi:EXOSC5 [Symbiodinium sp. CCMP2592]|nr:EXOSC5 [Symbiodinium sp. CCMP2592]